MSAPDARKGLGTYIILDHIIRAARAGLPYVYLGYWVEGSAAWPTRPASGRSSASAATAGGGWTSRRRTTAEPRRRSSCRSAATAKRILIDA